MIKSGEDEIMMGALILSAYSNPRKKNEMFMVTPQIDKITSGRKSFVLTFIFDLTKGNKISAARENLKSARVNGGVVSRDHLNMGAAAPQMVLAITSAIIAFWVLDSLGMVGLSNHLNGVLYGYCFLIPGV